MDSFDKYVPIVLHMLKKKICICYLHLTCTN